ncbi:MAG TPA: hypothetical protein VK020_09420 [Microlunatus sp.]|nr:hypothetical protein [Microlunatus sp.]
MLDDYWDPDSTAVDRRAPDEDEFGARRIEDGWAAGEPEDTGEWSGDDLDALDEPAGLDDDPPEFEPVADEPDRSSAAARAVLLGAGVVLGGAALLIAVLRRRTLP